MRSRSPSLASTLVTAGATTASPEATTRTGGRIWVSQPNHPGQWLTVAGIANPVPLASEIVGAVAGCYPAVRAARMPPAEALRSG